MQRSTVQSASHAQWMAQIRKWQIEFTHCEGKQVTSHYPVKAAMMNYSQNHAPASCLILELMSHTHVIGAKFSKRLIFASVGGDFMSNTKEINHSICDELSHD